jgi:hypothetical protein
MTETMLFSQVDTLLKTLSEEGEEGGEIGYRPLELYPRDISLEGFVPLFIQLHELTKAVKSSDAKSRIESLLIDLGKLLTEKYNHQVGFSADFALPPVFNQYQI